MQSVAPDEQETTTHAADDSAGGAHEVGRRIGEFVGGILALVLLIAIPALVVWLAIAVFPDELPKPSNPDFIDNIFDNRAVIWAARLLLVSGAFVLALGGLYIVVSMVIRMKNGEWLKRAGPFEVSETAVADLEGQIEYWRSTALDGQLEVEELRERVEASDQLIEQLHLALDDG
jgi:hypothetical protein